MAAASLFSTAAWYWVSKAFTAAGSVGHTEGSASARVTGSSDIRARHDFHMAVPPRFGWPKLGLRPVLVLSDSCRNRVMPDAAVGWLISDADGYRSSARGFTGRGRLAQSALQAILLKSAVQLVSQVLPASPE